MLAKFINHVWQEMRFAAFFLGILLFVIIDLIVLTTAVPVHLWPITIIFPLIVSWFVSAARFS
jgi:hypothetical protein